MLNLPMSSELDEPEPTPGSRTFGDDDPYAPPPSALHGSPSPDLAAAEATRRELHHYEVWLRLLALYHLVGIPTLALGLFASLATLVQGVSPLPSVIAIGLATLLIRFEIQVVTGLRALDSRVRGLATWMCVLGLFRWPDGTVVNLVLLTLLRSERGRILTSTDYRDVVDATPHLKYRPTRRDVADAVAIVVVILILRAITDGNFSVERSTD